MIKNLQKGLLAGLAVVLLCLGIFACAKSKTEPNVIDLKDTAAIFLYEESKLTAVLKDAAGNTISGTLTWASSDESKVLVSQDGVIKAIGLGSAVITVSAKGAADKNCTVTVTEGEVTPYINVSEERVELFEAGELTLSYEVLYKGQKLDADIVYSAIVADTHIAVFSEGKITAKKVGTTTLTVSATIYGAGGDTLIRQIPIIVKKLELVGFESETDKIVYTTDIISGHLMSGELVPLIYINSEPLEITPEVERTIVWYAEDLSLVTVADGVFTANSNGLTGTTRVYYTVVHNEKTLTSNKVNIKVEYPVIDTTDTVRLAKDHLNGKVLLNDSEVGFADTDSISKVFRLSGNSLTDCEYNSQLSEINLSSTEANTLRVVSTSHYAVDISLYLYDRIISTPEMFLSNLTSKPDGIFCLGANLDFTGKQFRTIEQPFTGSLDGKGFALNNISLTKTNFAGKDRGALFYRVDGQISNLAVKFVAPVVGELVAFVNHLYGNINNIYVDITLMSKATAYGGSYIGGVVSRLEGGVISNAIVNMNFDASIVDYDFIGSVVGINMGNTPGSINNCYAVTNGKTLVYNPDQPGRSVLYRSNQNQEGGRPLNSANYMYAGDFFANVTVLDSSKGWSGRWSFDAAGNLKMGDNVVLEYELLIVDNTATPAHKFVGTGATAQSIDLSKIDPALNATTIERVAIEEGDALPKTVSGGTFVISAEDAAALPDGETVLRITANNRVYRIKIIKITKVFMSSDKGNFVADLSANPNGYFELGENIDFDGVVLGVVQSDFYGTIDGMGYSLQNMSIKKNFFTKYYGDLKNISLGIIGQSDIPNLSEEGFINALYGNVSNIFLNYHIASKNDYGWNTNGALVVKHIGGSVRNVIANFTYDSVVGESIYFGSVVGISHINKTAIFDCYALLNGKEFNYHTHDTSPFPGKDVLFRAHASGGFPLRSANYSTAQIFFEQVIVLDPDNGWSQYWSFDNTGNLMFNNTVAISKS